MHSQTWYKNGENILCTKMQSVGFHLTYKWTTFYINKVFNSKFDALLFKTVFFIHRGTPNARFWGKLSPCKDICKRVIERQHHKKPHDNIIKWKQFPRYWLLWEESTGHRWIPLTKENDVELWCFLFFCQTVEQTIDTPVIWNAIALIVTSLQWDFSYLRQKWGKCKYITLILQTNSAYKRSIYIYIYMVV